MESQQSEPIIISAQASLASICLLPGGKLADAEPSRCQTQEENDALHDQSLPSAWNVYCFALSYVFSLGEFA